MMTEKKELGSQRFEKPWYTSKKFLAFLLMEILLSAMAMTALFTQKGIGWPLTAFMTGIVLTMGSIALTFNGYQAKLDMYVRAVTLTGRMPSSTSRIGFEDSLGTVHPPDMPSVKAPLRSDEGEL